MQSQCGQDRWALDSARFLPLPSLSLAPLSPVLLRAVADVFAHLPEPAATFVEFGHATAGPTVLIEAAADDIPALRANRRCRLHGAVLVRPPGGTAATATASEQFR